MARLRQLHTLQTQGRERLPLLIGNRRFLPDIAGIVRRPLPAMRQMVDQGIIAGEQSFSNEFMWKRVSDDFRLGGGQEWFDKVDESSRRRFWESRGIDPWDERCMKLLNGTKLRSPDTQEGNLKAIVASDYLYYIEGQKVRFSQNPDSTNPLWVYLEFTPALASDAKIYDITTDGSRVYMTDGTTIYKANVGQAQASTLVSQACKTLGFANGRLFAMNADDVYEIRQLDGTWSAVRYYNHTNPSWSWDTLCSAPNGVYLSGHAGDKCSVFLVTVNPSTGALVQPYHAVSMPDGETVNALCHYGGMLVIATTRGIRLGVINGAGHVTHGPLLKINDNQTGDSLDGVAALEPQAEFVWFSWHNYDSSSTGCGRLSLARFTEELVPAYAADIMASPEQGEVSSIVTYKSKRYFTVNRSGLWAEDEMLTEGWFTTGKITFGTNERKQFQSIELHFDDLPDGTTISVQPLYEDKDGLVHTASPGDKRNLDIALEEFDDGADWVNMKVWLRRSLSSSGSPCLQWWTIRGVPTPFYAEEIYIPIHLTELVQWDDADVPQDPWQEWSYLHDLAANRARVDYEFFAEKLSVYVAGISVEGQAGGAAEAAAPRGLTFTRDREWVQGTWVLRLVTVAAR